jgi:hypothetical protein
MGLRVLARSQSVEQAVQMQECSVDSSEDLEWLVEMEEGFAGHLARLETHEALLR